MLYTSALIGSSSKDKKVGHFLSGEPCLFLSFFGEFHALCRMFTVFQVLYVSISTRSSHLITFVCVMPLGIHLLAVLGICKMVESHWHRVAIDEPFMHLCPSRFTFRPYNNHHNTNHRPLVVSNFSIPMSMRSLITGRGELMPLSVIAFSLFSSENISFFLRIFFCKNRIWPKMKGTLGWKTVMVSTRARGSLRAVIWNN